MTWFSVLLPFLSLLVWSGGLILRAINASEPVTGGLCVFCVGSAWFCLMSCYFRFKWNNYQFDWQNGLYFILTFIFMSGYQFIAVFAPKETTVFGVNAVFLALNCIVMILVVFFNSNVSNGSIDDLIKAKMAPSSAPRNSERNVDFDDEINKEKANKDFIPTQDDISDIFTIGQYRSKFVGTVFGPGMQNFFATLPDRIKRLITLILWGVAIAILVIYSVVVKVSFPEKGALGFITMIAILTTDVLIYFIQKAEIVKTATPLCFTLFLNRLLLIIFGGDHWVYGYILIYLFYGLLLLTIIAKRRFPFLDTVKNVDIEKLSNDIKQKQNQTSQAGKEELTFWQKCLAFLIKAKTIIQGMNDPEHPLVVITLIYLIILIILTIVKSIVTIPLPLLHVHSRDVHFLVAWAFAVVLLCGYYTTFAVIRLFIRRKKGTTQKVYYHFEKIMNFKPFRVDRYWFFICMNLLSLVGIGIFSWWLTKSWTTCVIVIFVDLYLLCMMNFHSHYISNDYDILQDIKAVNVRVKNHNERYDKLKVEINDVKMKLKSGQLTTGLSKDLMDQALKMMTGVSQQFGVPSSDNSANVNIRVQPTNDSIGNNNGVQQQRNKAIPAASSGQDTDKLIEEEMSRIKPKDDEIYEGGDAEIVTEIFVDVDEEELVNDKKTRIKYKTVQDWRGQFNVLNAFWNGKLRKNDYQIIFSQALGLIVLIIGAWLICSDSKSWVGITIFVPFAHYSFAAFSHMKVLNTDESMNIFEYFCFIFAYLIQYGWGIANLYLTYEFGKPKNQRVMQDSAGLYIVVNLIVIPFITSSIAAFLKWLDNKGKISGFLIFQLIMTLLQGIGMLVCAFIFMTWIQGVIIACFIGVLCYIAFLILIFRKNDGYIPDIYQRINAIIIILLILASLVVSFFTPDFPIFMGFSVSVWILCGLLFVFGMGRVMIDYINLRAKPVFFSPWIFPVYRYDPKKQDLVKQDGPVISLIASLIILIGWAVLATVWFSPTHVGVALSIIFEMALLLSVVFLIQISQLQLVKVSQFVDNKILRRAWLEAKATYVASRNAVNRNELVTYEEMIQRRDIFRNKMRLDEGRTTLSLEEKLEGVKLLPQVTPAQYSTWLNTNLVDFKKPLTCYQYLFDIERDIAKVYKHELELIIMFQILIITYSEIYSDQKKKYLFNFLTERRPILLALDIVITVPANQKVNLQYTSVVSQIETLPIEKQAMFNAMREQFVQDMRILDEKRREQAGNEEVKAQERAAGIAEEKKRRKEGLKDNQNKPVNQWVDCLEKYNKILTDFKTEKFLDPQFKPDNASLGTNCTNRGVDQWLRASMFPNKKCVLFKEQVSHLDVKQGALGDCYFLSAISVLGEKNVREMIVTKEEDWQKTGCFCVRFFRDGDPEYVVVDDHFPVKKDESGQPAWAFVTGADGDELWPMVLEKAYAKFYGNYSLIEAGKVHYALADMIQGFPEQIDLKKDGKNIEVLWEKLLMLKRQGALMGAGSPENPMGDAAINQQGIVQGHAYSVLNLQEIDETKLIQLRNPHGSEGAEWKGDWSDTCPNWNQRMKSKLAYEPRDHEDGVFWMDIIDFQQQYSYMYICRILNESMGWKKAEISDAWKGSSAEGLPSRANPSARLELNPQYEVTISKPSDSFILLKQKTEDSTQISTFKGKHSIFFMISKNNGKRIKTVDKDLVVCRSGNPINLAMVSSECSFDKTISYPYKFTLLVANTGKGAEGEGEFDLTVYSMDQGMSVKALPQ